MTNEQPATPPAPLAAPDIEIEFGVENAERVAVPPLAGLGAPPPGAGGGPAEGAGEPPGADVPAGPAYRLTADLLVRGTFAYAATKRGPHWALDDDEADEIADPLAGELEELAHRVPFLGSAADRLDGRRARLVSALAGAIAPRIATDIAEAATRPRVEHITDEPPGDAEPEPIGPTFAHPPGSLAAELAGNI